MMRRLFEPVMRAVVNGFYGKQIRLVRKAVKEAKEEQAPLKIQPGTRTPVGFRYLQKELAPQDIWAPGALAAITRTCAQQARLNWAAWKDLDRETTETKEAHWRLPMTDEANDWAQKLQAEERQRCEQEAAAARLKDWSAHLSMDHDRLARNIQVVQNKLAALEMKLTALQEKLAKSTGDEK